VILTFLLIFTKRWS